MKMASERDRDRDMMNNDNDSSSSALGPQPQPTTEESDRTGQGLYQSALLGTTGILSNMTTAIVPIQQFSTIRLNTNLNHLPRDWAKTKFQGYGGCNNPPDNSFSTFTSLNLAHNHMDLVGRVDVISSSKNIKDLLKMPYQKSPHISLMVHRLGKTILLEEFDVHKNLIRQESEQWQWLNDFFQRYMNKDNNLPLVPSVSSPKKDLLSNPMYRNLIRHSITASVANFACTSLENTKEVPLNMHQTEEETQDLKGFHHESIWRFHDRSMLVDSDLPIFGTDSRSPCISLRLRDSPPINVLTGLDYWLDNLMSNVPEVAMVYHLKGFVQKYEILRTEDIPKLDNSKFDSEEVMQLAQNVMAFIKNKAAIEGHTYWLYKSEHDDTVKLYNLTDYCKRDLRTDDNPFTVPVGLLCYNVGRNIRATKGATEKNCAIIRSMLENCLRLLNSDTHAQVCADAHFLLADLWVPEHSLRDVWYDSEGKISDPPDRKDEDEFDSLDSDDMDGCRLKEAEGNAAKMETENNSLVGLNNMSLEESGGNINNKTSPKGSPKTWDANEVMMKELMIRGQINRKAWDVVQMSRIAGETDERCRCALDHLRKGLQIIDKDLARKSKKWFKEKEKPPTSSKPASSQNEFGASIERDELQFAMPFVPIPLHYSPLHPKNNDAGDGKTNADPVPTPESDSQPSNESESSTSNASFGSDSEDWHMALKLKLLRTATFSFSILASQFHEGLQKRGHTLRHIRYALHCYECLFTQNAKHQPDALEDDVYRHLLHFAAKARSCMDASGIAAHKKDFDELGEVEAAILHSAQAILQTPKEAWIYVWPKTEKENLKAARDLFVRLLEMKSLEKKGAEKQRLEVRRQYGVCLLNLGHIYYKLLEGKSAAGATCEQIEPLMKKCKNCYEEAMSVFLGLNERLPAGHIQATCLVGVYNAMAECVRRETTDPRHPVSKQEYALVDKIMAAYEKGLSIFERDESYDEHREGIYHNMRDKWFFLATRYFNVDTPDSYKKVKEHLQKSLSYCFLDGVASSDKHAYNRNRIGAIDHYNLAVILNREFAAAPYDTALYRSVRRKMYDHATKAFDLYDLMRWSRAMIDVKLFIIRVLMEEFYAKPKNQPKVQKKALRNVLWQLTSLQKAVDYVRLDTADSKDDCRQIPTALDGLKKVLEQLSLAMRLWLGLEKVTAVYTKVKVLYRQVLKYFNMDSVESIASPLSQFFTDLKELIQFDITLANKNTTANNVASNASSNNYNDATNNSTDAASSANVAHSVEA